MLSRFDAVMLVEHEHMGVMWYCAAINDRLAIVLACRLQIVHFEQAVSRGEKTDVASARGQYSVAQDNPAIVYQAWVVKPMLQGKVDEIVPIQGAA